MKLVLSLYSKHLSFFRFLIVGVLASAVNLLCFYILFYRFYIFEIASYSVSYILGVVLGFFLNKKWSFRYESSSKKSLFIRYLLLYTFNMFLGMGCFELILTFFSIEEILIQCIVIIITAISNYFGLKILVFK